MTFEELQRIAQQKGVSPSLLMQYAQQSGATNGQQAAQFMPAPAPPEPVSPGAVLPPEAPIPAPPSMTSMGSSSPSTSIGPEEAIAILRKMQGKASQGVVSNIQGMQQGRVQMPTIQPMATDKRKVWGV